MTSPKFIIPLSSLFDSGPTHAMVIEDQTKPDLIYVKLSDAEKFLLVPIPMHLYLDPDADLWELCKQTWIHNNWTKDTNEEIIPPHSSQE